MKQARTDLLRGKLRAAIAAAMEGELPEILYPPKGVKDLADWNLADASPVASPPTS